MVSVENFNSCRKEGKRIICSANCNNVVIGGIHLTHGAFLPNRILKELTATEDDIHKGEINWNFVFSAAENDWNEEQIRLYNLFYNANHLDRIGMLFNINNIVSFVGGYFCCCFGVNP